MATLRHPAGRSAEQIRAGSWLFRLRSANGFNVAGSVLGGTAFLVLAVFVGLNTLSRVAASGTFDTLAGGYLELLTGVCFCTYYLTLWWLMLSRPLPIARTDTVLPSVVAFMGTYLPCTWILFTSSDASEARHLVSAGLVLTGAILMIVVIQYLGRSFSIVPQARKLVCSGPYAIVRNPLYLVEEIAQIGFLVLFFSPFTLALFVIFGAVQVRRVLYEEKLLRNTFAEYDDYARITPRLVPYVW